jgi:hypothetical protein
MLKMTSSTNAAASTSINSTPSYSDSSKNITDIPSLVDQYRGSHGELDTQSLARDVNSLAATDFQQADAAYQAITNHLEQTGDLQDAGNFRRDVQQQFESTSAAGIWAPNHQSAGSRILRNNPMLEIRWESTVSALTDKSGFSAPLQRVLSDAGITVIPTANRSPAGSLGPSDPGSVGTKNNVNGQLASDAIANRYASAGYQSNREVNYDTATGRTTQATQSADALGDVRRVDVETHIPGSRPEMDTRILTESKVGYTSNTGQAALEAANDARLLQSNATIRTTGRVLENVGKVARPIGIALDIYSVGSAYRADGNTIGTNTQRTVSGITGSVAAGAGGAWAGAAAGAAIGSIVPGVGTAIGGAIGGIIGGIAGGWGGDVAGKAVFDWFS